MYRFSDVLQSDILLYRQLHPTGQAASHLGHHGNGAHDPRRLSLGTCGKVIP